MCVRFLKKSLISEMDQNPPASTSDKLSSDIISFIFFSVRFLDDIEFLPFLGEEDIYRFLGDVDFDYLEKPETDFILTLRICGVFGSSYPGTGIIVPSGFTRTKISSLISVLISSEAEQL